MTTFCKCGCELVQDPQLGWQHRFTGAPYYEGCRGCDGPVPWPPEPTRPDPDIRGG